MGDLRNKLRKQEQSERVRRAQAKHKVPRAYPIEPTCCGCSLKGLSITRPGGFGLVRFYAITGGWREPPKYYCENCLEAQTGEKPYGD